MKKYEDLNYLEQKEISKLVANWLKDYTNEVVVKVLENHREEIINNDFTMKLLNELYEREEAERKDIITSIHYRLEHFETYKNFDIHNHATTHSKSYRDVLYDMYIK